MTKILTYCFDNWRRPVLVFGLTALIMVLCELTNNHQLQDYSCILFVLGFLGLIISTIYQLVKGRWLFAILTTAIIGASLVALFFYSIFLFLKDQSMPDEYADKLTIPNNIKIYLPSDSNFSSKSLDTLPNFHIYSSFQPGLYSYAVWTKKIESGYCYLKAFEVTHNAPLSADRLKERTRIRVFNPSDTTAMFEMTARKDYSAEGIFTIFEGDWGKPYAARFEVWFVPDNGGQERKLIEKNFKIEGWQR